ncbi:septum site-determining protein MinC [Anaeromicropila populeti]|uniref:Probable septum site-determining protein MinC n=1 Tax=Anaeromicropila populeti TaxID=37658 RepID=A0A1I6L8K2_9FIRM|nr:septum site-determining protein MinC [Anaeromicropila populeti]SFR99580.1 septum site-determining protein MinC [Anaeromicropila populeti]
MNNSVIIKGTKSGIIVVLDSEMDFGELAEHVAVKFQQSAKFLGDATMALSFEGRVLSNDEQRVLLNIINDNSDLNIVCIVDTDERKEHLFEKTLNEKLMELSSNTGQFYKGNLRSGQVLEVETSIIVIGDVNNGAKVVSKGNIIILGALKGNVFAGAAGNTKAFVVALEMDPVQIRIGDLIARSPDKKEKKVQKETKIAFVEDGNIYIEPLSKDVINDIHL